MINFRGVKPIFIPAIWKLLVPPRVHIFLWLVSYNKIMTRDNLRRRHIIKPLTCVFCSSDESIQHLLFDCVVARIMWALVRDHFNKELGSDYFLLLGFGLLIRRMQLLMLLVQPRCGVYGNLEIP